MKPLHKQNKMHGICEKCSHRPTCKNPCAPVWHYLNGDGTVWEPHPDVVMPPRRETRVYPKAKPGDDRGTIKIDPVIGDFGQLKTVRSRVFYLRFFEGYTTDEVCDILGESKKSVYDYYQKSIARILQAFEILDKKAKIKDRFDDPDLLNSTTRTYLARYALGLSYPLIAEIVGLTHRGIQKRVAMFRDKLRKEGRVKVGDGLYLVQESKAPKSCRSNKKPSSQLTIKY